MSNLQENREKNSTNATEENNSTSNVDSNAFIIKDQKNSNSDVIDVVIAGAGIAGLVTALCLHRSGFSVRVFERAQVLEPIGFGLNLQPYCVKLLHELGLEEEMDKIGIRTSKAAYYSSNGQLIYEEPRGIEAGYNWPTYSMHRGHFQELLLRHVRDEVGETSVQLSQKLVAFRSEPNHVEVDFFNSVTNQTTTALARVFLGADGINSTTRKILYPNEGPPLWNSSILWRGVTSMDKIYLEERTMVSMGNPNKRFIIFYPVDSNLVNWACVIRTEETKLRPPPVTSDWDNVGNIEELLPLISDMKLDFVDIRHLIRSSMIVNRYPITDRDILPRWTHGRMTLLGDAAHPMYPYGGNGAGQAIVDARALTLCFRQYGITPEALQAYDHLRRERSHAVVLSAREYGPSKILQTIDELAPSGFSHLSDIIHPSEIEAILSKYKQLSDLNAQQLNQEAPLF